MINYNNYEVNEDEYIEIDDTYKDKSDLNREEDFEVETEEIEIKDTYIG